MIIERKIGLHFLRKYRRAAGRQFLQGWDRVWAVIMMFGILGVLSGTGDLESPKTFHVGLWVTTASVGTVALLVVLAREKMKVVIGGIAGMSGLGLLHFMTSGSLLDLIVIVVCWAAIILLACCQVFVVDKWKSKESPPQGDSGQWIPMKSATAKSDSSKKSI